MRPLMAKNILELIGNTPLVRLNRLPAAEDAEVLAKMESFNPLWSVKDRIGVAMLEAAEGEGLIEPGKTVVIEPTSGNTGIGLAMASAVKGYEAIFIMPESATKERRQVLLAFGAKVVLTRAEKGMKGAMAKAEKLVEETENGWMPSQFDNPANPDIHARSTGPEILDATAGDLHALVAGVGTGGTVSGTGSFLKSKIEGLEVIAVESADSPLLSGGEGVRPNRIQGISPGFIPGNYDNSVVNDVEVVSFEDAIETARRLAREEGIFGGISSGAVTCGALRVAKRLGKGKRLVAILPDLGERYLSHPLYADLKTDGFLIDATDE